MKMFLSTSTDQRYSGIFGMNIASEESHVRAERAEKWQVDPATIRVREMVSGLRQEDYAVVLDKILTGEPGEIRHFIYWHDAATLEAESSSPNPVRGSVWSRLSSIGQWHPASTLAFSMAEVASFLAYVNKFRKGKGFDTFRDVFLGSAPGAGPTREYLALIDLWKSDICTLDDVTDELDFCRENKMGEKEFSDRVRNAAGREKERGADALDQLIAAVIECHAISRGLCSDTAANEPKGAGNGEVKK